MLLPDSFQYCGRTQMNSLLSQFFCHLWCTFILQVHFNNFGSQILFFFQSELEFAPILTGMMRAVYFDSQGFPSLVRVTFWGHHTTTCNQSMDPVAYRHKRTPNFLCNISTHKTLLIKTPNLLFLFNC